MAVAALATSSCDDDKKGAPRVVVIGGTPKLSDPATGPLSPPDAVLVGNVAQGLVRFDAGGNIVGGLAERWNVSDDGLSYIFRIASTDWSNGRKVTAQQVARALKRSVASKSNSLEDAAGAIDEIVAMTDRVIEIRLRAPRPDMLSLLAQPELAVMRSGDGTGPFRIADDREPAGELRLTREILSPGDERTRREELLLSGGPVRGAVRAFAAGNADLVLGGTFADLREAQAVRLPRNSLRFDPAKGLFGLVPTRTGGVLDDPHVRRLLSQAIDRAAFIRALGVPNLAPRATVLEPGLDGLPAPAPLAWTAVPLAERRPQLLAAAHGEFGTEPPTLRLFVGDGGGADILFARLAADWGALGIAVERAPSAAAADLRLIDAVAPSTSPAWFLRQFRCGVAPLCDEETDKLLDAARVTLVPAQRAALLAQAALRVDSEQLFIPITAPVRWSLVSDRVEGFAGNRYARHTLTDLDQKTSAEGS
jgi:peptide/nickel transport system substrate-binding protein